MSLLKELAAKSNRKPGLGRPKRKAAPEDCPSPRHHLDGQIDIDIVPTNVVESLHETDLGVSQAENGTGSPIPADVATDNGANQPVDDQGARNVFEYGYDRPTDEPEPEPEPKAKPPRARKHKHKKGAVNNAGPRRNADH